jgi:sugar transferase (PEP-CTERM/EpsH1 system associated)
MAAKPRLLFVAHRLPYPPDKGERVRAYHELAALSREFDITLAAQADDDWTEPAQALGRWCSKVLVVRRRRLAAMARGAWSLSVGGSVTQGFFASGRLSREIAAAAAGGRFGVALGYSSGVLALLEHAPAARRVMDLVDADSAKWLAYARSAPLPRRLLYMREAGGVEALERRALHICDAVTVVSESEARELDPSTRIHVIGNGVDWNYFAPQASPGLSRRLVFVGSMNYLPNIDGVCDFVASVWPELRRRCPDVSLDIVGRDPAPAVRRLAREAGITVTGAVPDVRPYLTAATAVVAPLRIARGVQNKVLEALASGCCVVGSPAALEGLSLRLGQEALAASGAGEWVWQLSRVLDDTGLRSSLAARARQCAVERFGWDRQMQPLVKLCLDLAAQGAPSERAA